MRNGVDKTRRAELLPGVCEVNINRKKKEPLQNDPTEVVPASHHTPESGPDR